MKTAIILAAGAGTKIWPYARVRPKVMIPISNKPIIAYNVESLIRIGFENIFIAGGMMNEQIKNYFRQEKRVKVEDVGITKGTADSLLKMEKYAKEEKILVLYGDTIISAEDLENFVKSCSSEEAAVIAAKMDEDPRNWIGCNIWNGKISDITGHSRNNAGYRFGGFLFSRKLFGALEYNSGLFTETEVGMMSPIEAYLEMTLSDHMKDGGEIPAYICSDQGCTDIDKPWHILTANKMINEKLCNSLSGNILGEGSYIDETASLEGYVKLGCQSRIGRNVIIKGNIIVGDNSVIENGAILEGNNIVGSNTHLTDYCFIGKGSTVGDRCVVGHCAQLDGIIFNRVYLTHYMEIYGIVGENTDIGAATVCGSLRFDDGGTIHSVKGRRETPENYSCAVYIGDHCRTGVNTTLFPGVKIGAYSVIGPASVIEEDVPENSLVYPKQELIKKTWGFEKYGW